MHFSISATFISAGTANNEVMTTTELSKLKFDPAIYRANALQGLVYDPARELSGRHEKSCMYHCTDSKLCHNLSAQVTSELPSNSYLT